MRLLSYVVLGFAFWGLVITPGCGGGGGGGSLPTFFEVEPNNAPAQADVVANRVRILGVTSDGDDDWSFTPVDSVRQFRIELFLDENTANAFFRLTPAGGFFEQGAACNTTNDGRVSRCTGRFVPTDAGSGIFIHVDNSSGESSYHIDVRA